MTLKLTTKSFFISLFSCEAHQDKEFSPIVGFEITALKPYAKDTIKFTPPFQPPVIIDIPEEPRIIICPREPIDSSYVRTKPYTIVEKMPEFDGGIEAMMKYIRENLRYPKSEVETNMQGRVILRFTVTKSGKRYNDTQRISSGLRQRGCTCC